MSIKLHFLDPQLDFFAKSWFLNFNEEREERLHQDIKTMETRYQSRWNINMMADYCWSLKRDILVESHIKITPSRNFMEKRKIYQSEYS